jgi:wobble nucleotide-excising tRNase
VELDSGSAFSSGHSFSNTLSESDKRTLALAFFIARLEADPALSLKVVMLDDPVSSMDRNRRYQTIRRVAVLATKCKQLLVLSHDAYFIRQLRDHLHDLKPNPITLRVFGITRVENDYSAFCDCDLDEICESDYYRHHRMIAEYVEGNSSENIRDIAKAIRPLLEGYFHRRFPGHIPRNQMFGKIIADHIASATKEPLSHLLQHVTELREINEYTSQFHHDTNQDADSVNVVDDELLQFALRSLDMIYKNG